MNMDVSKLFQDAESLVDQGRLIPAVQALEEARKLTVIPGQRAYVTYNLGAIHYHRLGNGEAARREFLTAIQDFEKHGHGQQPFMRVIHANALENAMLLAFSFDEFDNLARRLEAVNPGVPILTGLVPIVREARERGEPWSMLMLNFAYRCYNRNDPKLDVGRYGQAKSTYHLLLTHRSELRLRRDDWKLAITEFCPLSMRMASDCMKVRGGDDDPHSPEEFLPILTEALPLVDEYLLYNSGDGTLQMFRGNMEEMVTNYRQRWASLKQERSVLPKRTDYQAPKRCRTVIERILLFLRKVWMPTSKFKREKNMGLFSKLFNGSENCSACRRPMTVLRGGVIVRTSDYVRSKGCFECRSCGRLTCYDCSDNRYPCECGAHEWIERMYLEGNVKVLRPSWKRI